MDLNEGFSYYFAKNEEKLNATNESNKSKMCAFRQQMLSLHQLGRETSEQTSCDLLQAHLDMMHMQFSKEYIQNRASNVKNILLNRKHTPMVKMSDFNADNDIQLEPLCRGVYESCKNNEISASDFDKFKKCLPHIYQNMGGIETSLNVGNNNNNNNHKHFAKTTVRHSGLFRSIKESEDNNGTVSTEKNSLNIGFQTALSLLKGKQTSPSQKAKAPFLNNNNSGTTKKSLGIKRTIVSSTRSATQKVEEVQAPQAANKSETVEDERLKNIEPKMIELIENEIMHKFKPIEWNDIAGLEYAKSIIKEAVVYPILRPDIFTGLRRPPKGILLFGPPGTGKTLIGKCIASQSNATFFSISASSLTSKWIGESEKMVRALFAVATVKQPSVVFIDEIDSLLSQRSDTEHESSRRLKTEFLVQLDGAATSDEDRVVIVGATNRPQELDEAARRRLVRRLYIPLPELEARIKMLNDLLKKVNNSLNDMDINELAELTAGYSGADIKNLCHESSMEPIRSIPVEQMPYFKLAEVRPIIKKDFIAALKRVRPTVSQSDLKQYADWNDIYGAAH